MESIASITVTIAAQVSIIVLIGLTWFYAAFKLTRAASNRKARRG